MTEASISLHTLLRGLPPGAVGADPPHRPQCAHLLNGIRERDGSPDTYPIQKLIGEYRIDGDRPLLRSAASDMDEWLRRLGSLPWLAMRRT